MLEPLDPAMTMFLKALKWFKLDRAVRPVFPRASFSTLFTCHGELLDRRKDRETRIKDPGLFSKQGISRVDWKFMIG